MQSKDIRTKGYVLRRTNFGEADRILNIITPDGKISAIAKGARKERSKLAGGIEMFTLSDYSIHVGKGQFGVVTGARMLKHYSGIVREYNRMELAAEIIKKINKVTDHVDNEEFFRILDQSLNAIDESENLAIIEAWYNLRLKKAVGEEVNLYRDTAGEKLAPDKKYSWDVQGMALKEDNFGEYGANEIKMLRLMTANDYNVVKRVKIDDASPQRILQLVRRVI